METLRTLDSQLHTEIITNLANQMQEHYVFPDLGKQVYDMLHQCLATHKYDELLSPTAFATLLTEQLYELTHDRHLRVRFSEDKLPPFDKSFDSEAAMERTRQQQMRQNYGVNKIELLPGNVGYLELRTFSLPYWVGDTIVATMNLLANTEALIIDLRKNGGGFSEMVAFLLSFFVEQKRFLLSSVFDRDGVCVRQLYTPHPYVLGKHYGKKPVYVLTSSSTASAAEEFTSHVKALNRGIIVGETTAGSGNPGDRRRLHDHFTVFIPSWMAKSALTNSRWEGVGITPHIEVPQENAFEVAYTEALKNIEETLENLTDAPATFKKEVRDARQALLEK